jgi:hypothetical protein
VTLTPEQRDLWEEIGVPDPQPEGEQTPEQAVSLVVHSFRYVCCLEGVEPPSEEAIRAEMDKGKPKV